MTPPHYSLDDYDAQHRHPLNRAAHAVGIPLIAAATLALALPGRRRQRRLALGGLAAGWGLLWTGHAIEGNRPAVLTNPAAALVALKWMVSRNPGRHPSPFPRDPQPDSTLALLREGYTFIGNRCRRFQSDAFEARLMFRKVFCVTGADAAQMFYTPDRLTRRRAVPATTLMLLQDFGSVQVLDGAAHRHRKQMFMSLMAPQQVERLVHLTAGAWLAAVERWQQQPRIELHGEVREILCRAVCAWVGLPLTEEEVRARTRELAAMIDGAGGAGPQTWRALLLRRRTERWAREAIARIRAGTIDVPAGSPAHVIAWHRERDGALLDAQTAAVELINLLRPTVAVARYITFAALALHDHPQLRAQLVAGSDEYAEWFAEEVRRFYPFFPAVGGRVRQAFEWRGHRFTEGDWLLFDLYGTNHDERTWADAEAFRPERFRDWDGSAFTFVPQGGGSHHDGHRCPGEPITVALVQLALRLLTTAMRYEVPPQDLRVDLTSMPALPASGFIIGNIRRI